jgi:hypothetical protein
LNYKTQGLEPPEKEEVEEIDHPFDKLSSIEALFQFFKSPRFWLVLIVNGFCQPFMQTATDWMNYGLQHKNNVSEGYATIITASLPLGRCIGVNQ